MILTINLPNFPEWAIPMTKVIPMTYVDDGYDLSTVTWKISCRHLWHVVPNSDINLLPTISLTIDIESSATVPGATEDVAPISIPTYVDINLQFLNKRLVQEVNANKS
jgi:hypothetical protein